MTGHSPGPHRSSVPTKWWACLIAAVALVLGVLVPTSAASAAPKTGTTTTGALSSIKPMTLDGFDAGNLISDAVFTDKNTMTEAQIQTFFNSKVSRCLGGTDEDGRPIVCLKDFTITSANRPADTYCNGYTGAPNESAARIIYRVAQSCGINPQVLIVMLQKEQGLVTHTWPSAWRFDIALGQGCPDDAACNPDYVGFFYQIYGAARQMKIYMEGRYFTYYAPGKTWNILYNPNRNCGSSPVYVANKATSALYYYTPYQPNLAALRAGYGTGDACSAYGNRNFYNYFTDWFGPTQGNVNNPFGNVELSESLPGKLRLKGWLADPNSSDSIGVHIYVDGVGYPFVANADRPDVGAAYPAVGSSHGFDVTIPATKTGPVSVCVYGINVGPGTNRLLGCLPMQSYSGAPVGFLDSAVGVSGGIQVSGWSLDPDVASPNDVHIYVDAAATSVRADAARTDVGVQYPAHGVAHGFNAAIPASVGQHNVCAYGINIGAGTNALLGCTVVTVPAYTDRGRIPIGNYESIVAGPGGASVLGWAIDPDTMEPISVEVSVDTVPQRFRAGVSRNDVGATYPLSGSTHGFNAFVNMAVGTHSVCITAVNNGTGENLALGCRSVTVATPAIDGRRTPVGYFESATVVAGGTTTVSGWAVDPDTTEAIPVHVYVDGAGAPYKADKDRPDIGAAYPASGSRHGFQETIALSAGTHQICVYGINNGAGGNVLLGCRNVTVAPSRAPFGYFESLTAVSGGANVSGWAIDPDTKEPIAIHVYVDGGGKPYRADKNRTDVGAAYPTFGAQHGFFETLPMGSGTHNVCVYAINNGVGDNPLLACRTVKVP